MAKKETDALDVQEMLDDLLHISTNLSSNTNTSTKITTIINGRVVESSSMTAEQEAIMERAFERAQHQIKQAGNITITPKELRKIDVTCKSCGAKSIVDDGTDNVCDYCGSLLPRE